MTGTGPWVFFLAFVLVVASVLLVLAYRAMKKQKATTAGQAGEIRKLNETLLRQNQRLQELNEERRQIISVVSHDLKGPFNRIFALTQLMGLSGDNLTDDQKEYVGKIHQMAVDGLHMVRNLLDSRTIDEEALAPRLGPVDLGALVVSFVKGYEQIALGKGIGLVFNGPGNLSVTADRHYLGRVLDNLLSNAIKFSPSGKEVAVMLEEREGNVVLTVKDEGPGISEADQENLYLRFRKLSAKPTGGESSTGLGLAIVKTLVEKMGGTITCDSREGEGTSFILSLKKEGPA